MPTLCDTVRYISLFWMEVPGDTGPGTLTLLLRQTSHCGSPTFWFWQWGAKTQGWSLRRSSFPRRQKPTPPRLNLPLGPKHPVIRGIGSEHGAIQRPINGDHPLSIMRDLASLIHLYPLLSLISWEETIQDNTRIIVSGPEPLQKSRYKHTDHSYLGSPFGAGDDRTLLAQIDNQPIHWNHLLCSIIYSNGGP